MNVSRRLALLGSSCLAGLRGSSQALATPTCQSLGQESPPGAVITGTPSTYVINASATPGTVGQGNIITITSGGQVAYNGITDTSTSIVTSIVYIDHSAFQGNSAGNYYGPITSGSSVGGGTPTATPGVGTVTDTGGNIWTVTAGGVAQENGVTPTSNFNVTNLYLISGVIWVVNTTPTAYFFTQTGTNVGTFTQGNLPAINTGGTALTNPLPVILLSNSSVAASAPSGTTVGTLSVTTGLPNGTIGTGAYTWVFSVSGTTAVTVTGSTLVTNGVLPGGTFTFQVSAANAAVIGSPFAQSFTISVAGAAGESAPGTAVTTTTGQLIASSTPGSPGTQYTIKITPGGAVSVNGDAGIGSNVIELYYINHTAFVSNTSPTWFGPITATADGGAIGGVPQPTVLLSNSTAPASSPAGTVVGAITVTTGLANGTVGTGAYTWALSLSGTNANDFQISGGNLQLAVANLAASTYSVTISATNSAVVGSPFTLPATITIGTATGTREWYQVVGGDRSLLTTPFQTTASWITSGTQVNQLRGLTNAQINTNGNFSPPLWISTSTNDVLCTFHDSTGTIADFKMHVPAGATSENAFTGAGDNACGFIDTSIPYMLVTINDCRIGSNAGNATASGVVSATNNFITCGIGMLVSDATGPIMMDAVTGATTTSIYQTSDNVSGKITYYDLQQLNANANYVIQHSIALTLGTNAMINTSPGYIWPFVISDLPGTGSIPEGVMVGIPASTTRPTGKTRGFYALFDMFQQFGGIFNNTTQSGEMNISVQNQGSDVASLVTDLQNSFGSVVPYLCILNYTSGTAGAQYGVSTLKGRLASASAWSDAFPRPPLLNFAQTNNNPITPSTFNGPNSTGTGAWQASNGRGEIYNVIWENNITP